MLVWAAPIVLALLLLPALGVAAPASEARVDAHPGRYDNEFRKWTKRYFGPGFDWRWFKAQAVVESGLKPSAVGAHGARGLMQVLPSTYAELKKKNPGFGGILEPRWNIAAGIYYNRQMYDLWEPVVAAREPLKFAFASYNAGPGRIKGAHQKAQKSGRDPGHWSHVERHAPRLTRRYVRRIHDLMDDTPLAANP